MAEQDQYEKMREAIKGSRQITNPAEGDRGVADVTALALIDIAESLRTMAFSLARGDHAATVARVDESNVVEPIDVGDWVAPNTDDEVADEDRWQVQAVDIREGEEVIDFGAGWVFARNFIKVEPLDEQPDPADHVDELDNDFAGDHHPEADAAREALAKAEKKAKKKGGK